MVATRRGARSDTEESAKASEVTSQNISSSQKKAKSRKSLKESSSEASNESPPADEPEVSDGEQVSVSSEAPIEGHRRLTRSKSKRTYSSAHAAEFHRDGDTSEAESASSTVSDVFLPSIRRVTRSRHNSAASGKELCVDSQSETGKLSSVCTAHELVTPSKKVPKKRQTEAEALLDTFVTTVLEAGREVGYSDGIPGSPRVSRSRITRGGSQAEPLVEQQVESNAYPIRTPGNISQLAVEPRLENSKSTAASAGVPATPKLSRIQTSKIVSPITEDVEEGSEESSNESVAQNSRCLITSSAQCKVPLKNLSEPVANEPKVTSSVSLEFCSSKQTASKPGKAGFKTESKLPVEVAADSLCKVEVQYRDKQVAKTGTPSVANSIKHGNKALEVVDVTENITDVQSKACHSLKDVAKGTFQKQKRGILSISSSEDEDDDDDDIVCDSDHDRNEVYVPKNCDAKSNSSLPQCEAMDSVGLFVIDKAPGLDTSKTYYLERKERVEELAEKSVRQESSEDDDEEEDKDEESDDEDYLLNKKSGVVDFSSSIDTGLNLKKMGGLYISFDAGKFKSTSNVTKQSKSKVKIDEHLRKSVITTDVRKPDRILPGVQPLRQLKKHRKKERAKTAGDGWFGMKAPEITENLKNDLKALKMRAAIDPKRFYKKNDREGFPKYFQVGTVVDSPLDFYSSRIPKKQRKRTMVEELLADSEFRRYNKKKFKQIMVEKAAFAAGKKNRIKKKFRK